jgi:hypothetical protein
MRHHQIEKCGELYKGYDGAKRIFVANFDTLKLAPEMLDILETIVKANEITRHYAPEFLARIYNTVAMAKGGE